MLSRKNLFAAVCVLTLLLAAADLTVPHNAKGQMTIPTRTPVPDDDPTSEPEPKPTDDNDGGSKKPKPPAQPDPTNEPEPSPTAVPSLPPATAVPTLIKPTDTPVAVATNTPTATPSATVPPATETATATATVEFIVLGDAAVTFPANNKPFPQADVCGIPPTFTSLDANSIYAGPSDAYQLVGLIGATEVRPIVGRAAFRDWWVIQLDGSGRAGWISDDLGDVHGYTGRVQIISAPELYGIAPTPGGDTWVPTPDANCSASEFFAGIVVDYKDDGGKEVPPSGKPDSLEGLPKLSQVDDEKSPLIQTAAETGAHDEAATQLLSELADTAAPLELPPPPTSQLPNLFPVVGLVLILAAVIIGLFARRNRPGASK